MARQADEDSVRQKAFRTLDNLRTQERKIAISIIKALFNLGDHYADSLYATHRQMGKDAGLYTTTYLVREKKGKPYLATHVVFEPAPDAFTCAEDAKVAYLDTVLKKIDTVATL
jgi:hypothetical protein